MHETHLIEKVLKYFSEEEKRSCRRIKRAYIAISEFGGISEEQFKEHYIEKTGGTRWEGLALEIKKVESGPELEITRLDFESLAEIPGL